MNAFLMTVIALGCFAMVRNDLVYRVRKRRLEEISRICKRELNRPDFIPVMLKRYAELDERSYNGMLLDLRCWTYLQFFPEEVA